MTAIGVDTVLVAGVVVVVAAVAVFVLLLAPWKSVRNEKPLDTDTETRLLLGEDPAQVAADVEASEARRGPDAGASDSEG